jgi:hypothetical protein
MKDIDQGRDQSVKDLPAARRPQWRRPEVAILDVERGTVTTSGPVADGNGSTS